MYVVALKAKILNFVLFLQYFYLGLDRKICSNINYEVTTFFGTVPVKRIQNGYDTRHCRVFLSSEGYANPDPKNYRSATIGSAAYA
jgi:hypothetical protein